MDPIPVLRTAAFTSAVSIEARKWYDGKVENCLYREVQMIAELRKYRFLLEQLVSRDFKTKYKRSVLGVLWSLLYPLITMLIMNFIFSNLFKFSVKNYPIYIFSGLLVWNYFNDAISQSMMSVINNAQIIKKIYIPKMIFPLSKAISSCINLGISAVVLLIIAMITGVTPSWTWLLLPYPLACVLLFSLGFSFIMSACVVFLRDLQYLWGIIGMIWMYMTPIIYPMDIIPVKYGAIIFVLKLNPIYHYVSYVRQIVMEGRVPTMAYHAVCLASAVIMLVVGRWVFNKLEDRFILYL